MSDFLENLKKAADNGEFNSDAAKKILEVHELADQKSKEMDTEKLQETLQKRMEESPVESKDVSEEEVLELNSQYEKKMEEIKLLDSVNARLATLIEIEDMVKLSIDDMMSHVEELEAKFEEEFKDEVPVYGDLHLKIEEIKSNYKS